MTFKGRPSGDRSKFHSNAAIFINKTLFHEMKPCLHHPAPHMTSDAQYGSNWDNILKP